jgi:hypothetical protein
MVTELRANRIFGLCGIPIGNDSAGIPIFYRDTERKQPSQWK